MTGDFPALQIGDDHLSGDIRPLLMPVGEVRMRRGSRRREMFRRSGNERDRESSVRPCRFRDGARTLISAHQE